MKSPLFWIFCLYILTAKGHLEIIDTEYSVRTAKAILETGSMLIDPVSISTGAKPISTIGLQNKEYSQYGVGILIIFIPIVALSKLIVLITSIDEQVLTNFLLSFYNIPFAILGLWHFRGIIKILGQNHNTANFLLICLGVGTIFWKYVVTDFSEITQICLLLGAIHSYIKRENQNRWFAVSGYLSLLVLVKIVYVIVIPPFIILAIIEGSKLNKVYRYLLQGASFLLPTGFFLMLLNKFRYGNVLEAGYGKSQSAFSFGYLERDWFDYLFSFDRGLLPYSPLIIFAFLGLKKLYANDKKLFFLIFTISVSMYLLTASWIGWKGGYCWGNRNIVPIVPIIAIGWGYINFSYWLQKVFLCFFWFFHFPFKL